MQDTQYVVVDGPFRGEEGTLKSAGLKGCYYLVTEDGSRHFVTTKQICKI